MEDNPLQVLVLCFGQKLLPCLDSCTNVFLCLQVYAGEGAPKRNQVSVPRWRGSITKRVRQLPMGLVERSQRSQLGLRDLNVALDDVIGVPLHTCLRLQGQQLRSELDRVQDIEGYSANDPPCLDTQGRGFFKIRGN